MSLSPGPHQDGSPPQETAAEWAARFEREGRGIRLGCGLVIGFFVGLFVLAKVHGHISWLVALWIVAACMIVVGLAYRASNDRGTEAVDWLTIAEYRLFALLPLWALVLVVLVVIGSALAIFAMVGIKVL